MRKALPLSFFLPSGQGCSFAGLKHDTLKVPGWECGHPVSERQHARQGSWSPVYRLGWAWAVVATEAPASIDVASCTGMAERI